MKLQVQDREAYAYTGGKPFDPTLPCVVFIHGALNDHSVWTLLARWFAHHGRSVLAVDLPAHSRSAGPPLADVEAAADWVVALLQAAGVTQDQPGSHGGQAGQSGHGGQAGPGGHSGQAGPGGHSGQAGPSGHSGRVALVGHSMGSLIALEAAARAPALASHLVMVGTAFPMAVSAALLSASRDTPLQAIDQVTAFSHSTLAAKPSFPGPGAWLHGGARALMRRVLEGWPEGNLFHHDFSVCNSYAGGRHAAGKVRCPVDVVLGERDQMTLPRTAHDIAQALSARIHRVRAGHDLMAEAPDEVLNALRAAFSRPAGPLEAPVHR
jgi:pimeloyl-ACP methyl ester carboxylesterase